MTRWASGGIEGQICVGNEERYGEGEVHDKLGWYYRVGGMTEEEV